MQCRTVLPPSRNAVEAIQTREELGALRGVDHRRVLTGCGAHIFECTRQDVRKWGVVWRTIKVHGSHVCADDRAAVYTRAHLVARVAGTRGIADDVRPGVHIATSVRAPPTPDLFKQKRANIYKLTKIILEQYGALVAYTRAIFFMYKGTVCEPKLVVGIMSATPTTTKTATAEKAPRRAIGKPRAPARPYKKVSTQTLQDRISTMQKQLHVMGCKTALLQHRLSNYESEQQQRNNVESAAD